MERKFCCTDRCKKFNTLRKEGQLTTWRNTVFQNTIVLQLVKKFPLPPILCNPEKFHYRIHNSPPLVPILNKLNEPTSPYPNSLASILILFCHLLLSLPNSPLSSFVSEPSIYLLSPYTKGNPHTPHPQK